MNFEKKKTLPARFPRFRIFPDETGPGRLGQYDRRYGSSGVRDGNSADTDGNFNTSRFIRFLKADETPVKSVAIEFGG